MKESGSVGFSRVATLLSFAFLASAARASAQKTNPTARQDTKVLQESLPADASKAYKYVGPGSSSASACHGGIQARDTTKVLQDEYSTWIVQDRHSRAFTVLTQPLALRMAKILEIGELKSDIDQMYRLLDNPSAYSAPKFAAQMKKTSAAIR